MSGLLQAINDINNMQTRNNYYNARYSINESERNLSSIKEYCNNKFNFFKLKSVFFTTILPILLLILFAWVGVSSGKIYAYTFMWIVGGFVYSAYLNYKYAYVGWKINNAREGDISLDNCGF